MERGREAPAPAKQGEDKACTSVGASEAAPSGAAGRGEDRVRSLPPVPAALPLRPAVLSDRGTLFPTEESQRKTEEDTAGPGHHGEVTDGEALGDRPVRSLVAEGQLPPPDPVGPASVTPGRGARPPCPPPRQAGSTWKPCAVEPHVMRLWAHLQETEERSDPAGGGTSRVRGGHSQPTGQESGVRSEEETRGADLPRATPGPQSKPRP